jgi:hypothetical protein
LFHRFLDDISCFFVGHVTAFLPELSLLTRPSQPCPTEVHLDDPWWSLRLGTYWRLFLNESLGSLRVSFLRLIGITVGSIFLLGLSMGLAALLTILHSFFL